MKDRLTKKRVKVDYEHIINVLGLSYDFTAYLFKYNQRISMRRSALAFLRRNKVNIEFVNYLVTKENIKSHFDLLNYCHGSLQQIKEFCYEL